VANALRGLGVVYTRGLVVVFTLDLEVVHQQGQVGASIPDQAGVPRQDRAGVFIPALVGVHQLDQAAAHIPDPGVVHQRALVEDVIQGLVGAVQTNGIALAHIVNSRKFIVQRRMTLNLNELHGLFPSFV
jgi:hypothetical protein